MYGEICREFKNEFFGNIAYECQEITTSGAIIGIVSQTAISFLVNTFCLLFPHINVPYCPAYSTSFKTLMINIFLIYDNFFIDNNIIQCVFQHEFNCESTHVSAYLVPPQTYLSRFLTSALRGPLRQINCRNLKKRKNK